jgi:hypothetical protein
VRALLRRLIVAAVALGAAAALYLFFTLPPRALTLDGATPSNVAFGAYHVHSVRSDGTGTITQIAQAAADAGLSFVIVTDHGDATRPPEPPSYLHGVLVIDGVELNTEGGHLVALGLNDASPYPLAGKPADVIEDVHRQGGWVVVAHPDSARPGLRWRAGQTEQDAVEWLNADSEWRDNSSAEVVGAGIRSLIRPAESVVSLFDRPVQSLARWDRLTRSREVVGLAAADAHGGIPRRGDREGRAWLRLPGYAGAMRACLLRWPRA